jgi:Domain of unknown function (DUF3786)
VLGVEQAWEELAGCDPADVCGRAAVQYSEDHGYVVPVFGSPIVLDMKTRTMSASSPESEFVLNKTAYFSHLSILFYLLRAQKIAPTGRLLKPSELVSSQIYLKGSHLLPLEPVAARFGSDPEAFLAHAARFGGRPQQFGDAAVELLPFPRVPIVLILWLEDDEFAARSYMLFDEVCELQLPADILWSVAMMCALIMLQR